MRSRYPIQCVLRLSVFFFFNDTATTEIYTLSLHDALPICPSRLTIGTVCKLLHEEFPDVSISKIRFLEIETSGNSRSEEHTSELQSRSDLVCRLLLEKKKKGR